MGLFSFQFQLLVLLFVPKIILFQSTICLPFLLMYSTLISGVFKVTLHDFTALCRTHLFCFFFITLSFQNGTFSFLGISLRCYIFIVLGSAVLCLLNFSFLLSHNICGVKEHSIYFFIWIVILQGS